MDRIVWCVSKKGGIELTEANLNLADAYLKKAEDSLRTMRNAKSKSWEIVTAYYAMYFSIYSILMRIGVKCEIHSCTIEFAKRFLGGHLGRGELELLEDSMDARVDAQYYVDRDVADKTYKKMIASAPAFMTHCKSVKERIDDKTVSLIRERPAEFQRGRSGRAENQEEYL